MSRLADRTLHQKVGISYRRFICLYHISLLGAPTQHALALSMGYSDPAVSNMVVNLKKLNLITISVDPTHRRRRVIQLTQAGASLTKNSLQYLDVCFEDIMKHIKIDEAQYAKWSNALLDGMKHKIREDS